MDLTPAVLQTIDDALCLQGRTATWSAATPLLGVLPELDSMAVVDLLIALSERFDILLEDDIDGDLFATVGSLVEFVMSRATAG